MAEIHTILTELVLYAKQERSLSPGIDGMISTATANATKQIKAQQRERADILRSALDRIWTNPMTAELARQISGNALAEWKMKGATDD